MLVLHMSWYVMMVMRVDRLHHIVVVRLVGHGHVLRNGFIGPPLARAQHIVLVLVHVLVLRHPRLADISPHPIRVVDVHRLSLVRIVRGLLVECGWFDQTAVYPTIPPVYELLVVHVLVLRLHVVGLLQPVGSPCVHLVLGAHHGDAPLDVVVRLDHLSGLFDVGWILPVSVDGSPHLGLRSSHATHGVFDLALLLRL